MIMMEKLKNLLTSKSFWTLVSAIVAALAAFFLSSCVGYQRMMRKGLHVDTVYMDTYVRHKNFVP